MPPAPASTTSPYSSLSQKLRGLGSLARHRFSKGEEDNKASSSPTQEFQIVHTPDRPERLVSPVEAPTEEECGDEIARWQLQAEAADAEGGRVTAMVMYSRYDHGRTDLEDTSSVSTEIDDDYVARPGHDGTTEPVVGQALAGRTRPLPTGLLQQPQQSHSQLLRRRAVKNHQQQHGEDLREQARYEGFDMAGYGYQQRQSPGTNDGMLDAPSPPPPPPPPVPAPAPLFSGRARAMAPTSHPRSFEGVQAVGRGEEEVTRKYTGVRTGEIYRDGLCPYCRKYFGRGTLPMACPYLDCQRDLRKCLWYPNRREAEKAPPRLYERPFLDMAPKQQQKVVQRPPPQTEVGQPGVPSFNIEAPTPTDDPLPSRPLRTPPPPPPIAPPPSPPRHRRWERAPSTHDPPQRSKSPAPSAAETEHYREKPLPRPPPPPPKRSERRPSPPPPPPSRPPPAPGADVSTPESIAERHQSDLDGAQLQGDTTTQGVVADAREQLELLPPRAYTPQPQLQNQSQARIRTQSQTRTQQATPSQQAKAEKEEKDEEEQQQQKETSGHDALQPPTLDRSKTFGRARKKRRTENAGDDADRHAELYMDIIEQYEYEDVEAADSGDGGGNAGGSGHGYGARRGREGEGGREDFV
ncbi:hypothetical protein VTJ49DRAFT_1998 [Mycothermus thermophilus]|uniref:Uncharacterized protein n=1 Tax=Humicola insolens TaxID=85995 RepID=A0ABR3VBA1_HUMIN